MVTGDHLLIAKETCRELGMGTNILNTEVLNDPAHSVEQLDEIIMNSHGFAEVMPEHKFQIVERIRHQGHVTGMTGDGVNDAPALKRADIGIAVFPATDAAKAAADIVLTEPGLSVIIDAIFRSRKIFQRMRNYCIYRISCTLQLLFFFVRRAARVRRRLQPPRSHMPPALPRPAPPPRLPRPAPSPRPFAQFFAIMAIDPNAGNFWNGAGVRDRNGPACGPGADGKLIANEDCPGDYSFTLPVISLVIITILNDGTMITIAHDKVIPEKRPQKWAMFEVTVVSLVLGAVACLSSMIMLVLVLHSNIQHRGDFVGSTMGSEGRNYVRWQEARTMMYLKISISDFLTLFSARTRVWFFERRPGYALGVACLVATACSTLLSLFWDDAITADDAYMKGLRGSQYAVVATWIYCVLWFFVQDVAKVFTYQALEFIFREDHERMRAMAGRGMIAGMINAEQRELRKRGVKIGADEAPTATQRGGHQGEMTVEIASLKRELAELRAMILAKK